MEAELVQKLVNSEESAFRVLIDKYRSGIFKICMGFLHHKEDAEDVAQEVFIEVYKSIKQFENKSNLSTWLYRIAVNKSINAVQKRKVRKVFYDLQKAVGFRTDIFNSSNPHQKMEQKENATVLSQTIDKLPQRQRIAYILAKYDELSYKEISEVMDTSLASVELLIHRAKTELQKRLLDYYEGNY